MYIVVIEREKKTGHYKDKLNEINNVFIGNH